MDFPPSISARAFGDEKEAVALLLAQFEAFCLPHEEVFAQARDWIVCMREGNLSHGVEAFLATYNLSTSEGVALIGLAEALLRIPDAATADALIRDTFEGRDFGQFSGATDSWLLSLSRWGLLVTGKVVDYGSDTQQGALHAVKGLVYRLGEPIIREALKRAMKIVGSQFVLGETVEGALAASVPYLEKGYRFSYDILGEGARSDAQAMGYVCAYHEAIEAIAKSRAHGAGPWDGPGMSIKLSALHPRYQWTQRARVMKELLPRLQGICIKAREANIAISIDAEEASRLDVEMLVFERLLQTPELQGWNGIGFVLQAYQKRAVFLVDWLSNLARVHKRVFPIRLVKGAYWDSEIKHAQQSGLPGYPVFTRKVFTDLSYLVCAARILQQRECFYPQFATHNAHTAVYIRAMAAKQGWQTGSFEFQRLHGMGEALHDLLMRDTPTRIYAPIGPHKDLLAYLIRRLLENGANTSFVHQLMERGKPVEALLVDLPEACRSALDEILPIAVPEQLYGVARRNSAGVDWGNEAQVDALLTATDVSFGKTLPDIEATTLPQLGEQLADALTAQYAWERAGVEYRAAVLECAADLLELHQAEFLALCASESGKTLADGVAEVREAADFCRYYAAEARRLMAAQLLAGPSGESNRLELHARGVFACISPWNFPLAIFTGQVASALVTGNAVIAKPAEQTPCIAMRAVELFYQAGVPLGVLQLAIGEGHVIGAALVRDERVSGVVFTGGTDTAKQIAQSLAVRRGPIVPLIAETGGQNCMLVDSSALLERAVDDILLSAFGCAGQRCSALRVLFVQEEVADDLLNLLAGAMQALVVGDPFNPATDIGPVIDAKAQQALLAHIERMKREAKLVAVAPAASGKGCFVLPHVFEIDAITRLTGEVFGPVLHVIRYSSGALAQVAEAINSTGYGLTFGIHSRVDEHIRLLAERVRAGNIYVNRSMIGAVVGVQPFGGEGLSGTGPKAGGPHYLLRFVSERMMTLNTAAIGGNIALLIR